MSFHYLRETERQRDAGALAHRQQTAIQVWGCGCPRCTMADAEEDTCRATARKAAH